MNSISIIGRITNETLEIKQVGEYKLLNFSIAYNEIIKQKEYTSFFDVECWGRTAEVVAQYFRKGYRIGVDGKIKQERFTDKNGNNRSRVKIVLKDFTFIEQKSDTQNQNQNYQQQQYNRQPASFDNTPDMSNVDVPWDLQQQNNQSKSSRPPWQQSDPDPNENKPNEKNPYDDDDDVPF